MPNFSIRGAVPGNSALPIENIFSTLCDTRKSTEALLSEVKLMREDNDKINTSILLLLEKVTESIEELKNSQIELTTTRTEMREESGRLRTKMTETQTSLDANSAEIVRGRQDP